jgi:hypothetical protein
MKLAIESLERKIPVRVVSRTDHRGHPWLRVELKGGGG